jgi:uncharacterized protein with HEPN domain
MRSERLRLLDIFDAITEVERYLPADRAVFDRDPLLQSHIYRHLTIIGEATRHLSAATKMGHPQVPWRQIEGMRHIMVHDYFSVDWNIVYEVARRDLPELKVHIRAILDSLPPQDPS